MPGTPRRRRLLRRRPSASAGPSVRGSHRNGPSSDQQRIKTATSDGGGEYEASEGAADMEGTRSVKNVYDRRSLKVDGCERRGRRRVRRELISRRPEGGDAAGFGPRVPLWFACIRNSPCHNFGLLKTCFQMERQERGERWDFNMSCRTSKSSLMWKQQGL